MPTPAGSSPIASTAPPCSTSTSTPAKLTWDCPAGREFDQQLAGYCGDYRRAIDTLRANALGLSGDADDYERHGAAELVDSD